MPKLDYTIKNEMSNIAHNLHECAVRGTFAIRAPTLGRRPGESRDPSSTALMVRWVPGSSPGMTVQG
jgi:hypothetical protein